MKLTKLQRFTAYCIMREEAENGHYNNDGLCYLIKNVFEDVLDYGSEDEKENMQRIFPELYAKKPIKEFGYVGLWFDNEDWQPRIRILDECIAETSPDTTQSPNR